MDDVSVLMVLGIVLTTIGLTFTKQVAKRIRSQAEAARTTLGRDLADD